MARALLRLAGWLMLALAMPALAAPFADVGDRQLRQDVALLAAAGYITGPVDSWPLPWAQIDAGIARARDGRVLPPHLQAAVTRLDRLGAFAAQSIAIDAKLAATNNVSVARDFGHLARGRGDAIVRAESNGDIISVAVGVGYRTDQIGGSWHLEPSQVTLKLGNWAIYGGTTEQWFGPGVDGALLFSNSARPFPKVGIKRLNPDPIDLPVLRCLGPVRLDRFVGVLDEERDFRNTLTVGTRLGFTPARGLEIGLNRAQMLCGQGRPCRLKQIASSFIGIGNADNPTPGDPVAFVNQAGNQLAGFDISYTQRFGHHSAKFYFEGEAEDFDNILLEQWGRLIGVTVAGPWGGKGASYTTTLEYSDTLAASLFNGTPLEGLTRGQTTYPTSFYNNSLYTSGFTYRLQPIGHWTDGESKNLAFHAALTDTRNRRWYASARAVHLNRTNLGNPPQIIAVFGRPPVEVVHRISRNAEKFAILTAGAELPTRYGDIRVEARWQSDSPNTLNRRAPRGALEVQLRQRF
jgi:hypothetical protein